MILALIFRVEKLRLERSHIAGRTCHFELWLLPVAVLSILWLLSPQRETTMNTLGSDAVVPWGSALGVHLNIV